MRDPASTVERATECAREVAPETRALEATVSEEILGRLEAVLMSVRQDDGTILTEEAVAGLAGRDVPLKVEGGIGLERLRVRIVRAWIDDGLVRAELEQYLADEGDDTR